MRIVERNFRIIVEGNIGAGKSSILECFRDLGWNCIDEQIEEWPSLGLFYENPKKYGFQLQMEILDSYSKPLEGRSVMVRSPETSLEVFSKHLLSEGILTLDEFSILKSRVRDLWKPDVVIYLHASPELFWDRIQGRGLPGDEKISLEYLFHLQKRYETYMESKAQAIPVFQVDVQCSREEVSTTIKEIMQSPVFLEGG